MQNRLIVGLLAFASVASAQDDSPPPPASEAGSSEAGSSENGTDAERAPVLEKAVELRGMVREMRKSVLGGGPAVVKSEKEALDFYGRKIRDSDNRVDEIRTQRDSREAEYDLALEATLGAPDDEGKARAARHAATIRTSLNSLESELSGLNRERKAYSRAIMVVESRIARRKRILNHFDEPVTLESMPFAGADAIGPDDGQEAGPDPFQDDTFLADLLRKDPVRARALVLRRNPARYWKLFPLTPPEAALRQALAFPPADLPGGR